MNTKPEDCLLCGYIGIGHAKGDGWKCKTRRFSPARMQNTVLSAEVMPNPTGKNAADDFFGGCSRQEGFFN
jgi:hypothetical protein